MKLKRRVVRRTAHETCRYHALTGENSTGLENVASAQVAMHILKAKQSKKMTRGSGVGGVGGGERAGGGEEGVKEVDVLLE